MSPWPWASWAAPDALPDAGAAVYRVDVMTNTLSLVLGTLLVGAIAFDAVANDGDNLLFLGKKLAELIEWLAFWR